MALQCGIVGLPNVGKSTLFNCLSNAKAQSANFPFCTIEPNVGVISVPDERLNRLAEIVNPQRIVPATVEIVDIAGLVKGASKGEGLGNKFLANIRETDAIIHVLRCFDDPNVVHVDGSVNPVRDKEIIDYELQLKDLETIDSRITRVQKQAQTGGDKAAKLQYEVLRRYKEALEQGKAARTVQFDTKDEQKCAHDLFLLTNKPVLYVCNVDDKSAVAGNAYVEQVREAVKDENAEILIVAAQTESEIAEFETYEERQMFLEEIGLKESGVSRLIRAAFHLLNLETYFTAGPLEVRAWTYLKGSKAPQCAGVIHSDFEKGFIRAEVIKYDDYIALGGEAQCREAGKIGIEGKDYVVQDGDIMHFRFNV
ncbi:MAG TPA: redox-regulated ATPase YchF [Candidatus Limisoma gallistercoris]|nr:redox-regulated ATPase YchF [Candidatus Limisoma gallistercoris]